MCPWANFEPAKIVFCEHRLCSWVVEPANTWSNIGYLIVGLLLCYYARGDNRKDLQVIGYIGIYLAFASSALHATGTFWGEWIDHSAMNLFAGFALAFNVHRVRLLTAAQTYWLFLASAAVPSVIMLFWKPGGVLLFTAMIVLVGLIEIYSYRRVEKKTYPRKHLYFLIGWFGLAYAIWNLDYHGVVCNPHNHILQGHSLWHFFNAFCFYHLYRYFRQFPAIGSRN